MVAKYSYITCNSKDSLYLLFCEMSFLDLTNRVQGSISRRSELRDRV